MKRAKNPYPCKSGFGLRYHYAKRYLEIYGQDSSLRPYSRQFDNCFEMFDGDAVVWSLMHSAIAQNNTDLAAGIRRMGKNVWPQWLEVYEQRGNYAPEHEQLSLVLAPPPSNRPTGKGRGRPKTPSI